jgi:putative membrane protein
MIFYDTEAKWYRFLLRFLKLSSLWRAFKLGAFFGVYAFLIRLAFDHFDIEFTLSRRVFETLATLFTILIVLRTTQAYNRWWEARQTWGALVNCSRNLAIYIDRFLPEGSKKAKDTLALHIANFFNALAYHLRDEAPKPEYYALDKEIEKELDQELSHPIVFSSAIIREIKEQYKKGKIDGNELLILGEHHGKFIDILGINERIKKAPIPFSYIALIKTIILSFGFLAPLQEINSVEVNVIPVFLTIIMTLVILLEILAAEIEDPFETRENDLPLIQMANVISKDVFNILGQKEHNPRTTEMKPFQKVI